MNAVVRAHGNVCLAHQSDPCLAVLLTTLYATVARVAAGPLLECASDPNRLEYLTTPRAVRI
jgi:hypothetical protein